jgi:short subunit dehydrogenase-like uncharacterized protein
VTRIVLFGATGYTGRLTAEALVRRGAAPVLAGRNADALKDLAAELGGLEIETADVAEPETVRRLADGADVLVTTVGPFVTWGDPAVEAAIEHGVPYLDSTGEPVFIRKVFEEYGPRAPVPLLTAFGYDYVPGNLAAAVALEAAGDRAARVDVGYFTTGKVGLSAGTFASIVSSPPLGEVRTRSFEVDGEERGAMSVRSSEHYTLPRIAPSLREVNAYLGWFGTPEQAAQAIKSIRPPAPGSGPDEETRKQGGSHVVAIAYDADGNELATARATGADGYTFTAELLAWGALNVDRIDGTGALGPVDAFGLDALREGCASAGISVG